MKGPARSQLTEQEGAVAILVAILLVVLLAAVAMSVDAGGLYLRRRALVNGSDSAALAGARTCARIQPVSAVRHPRVVGGLRGPGERPITPTEVAGTNITAITQCGTQSGHVSVQYTSQQGLYFAPVLGFNRESPVTTTATASWGLGSNNPVPIVLSSLLGTGACPVPPNGAPDDRPDVLLLVRQRPPERRQLRVLEPRPSRDGTCRRATTAANRNPAVPRR